MVSLISAAAFVVLFPPGSSEESVHDNTDMDSSGNNIAVKPAHLFLWVYLSVTFSTLLRLSI